ncbi:sorbin and SH3 domain-containing protein 1 isoform X24 [Sitodiplosis mosellana]|uniref:sorbin and SH3 domain-containing protein 1 isoform X24 n=1 Tax=Sitodiplosis mosellana TaxID=263140 RepID=UPI00244429A3|nr:sorbin and SH3 domain-containing protein 1 isoform X24 [Sitodiplosis mosellana]
MVQDNKQPVVFGPKFKATAPKGIWSPSGTPQPIRRAFPNEGGQFKSEPSLVHSTPSTPVAERRDIRSVKFESPITPRKNLSQQMHSGSTPSLIQPTIIVQPPPTSPKYKEHSTSEHGADHSKIRSYYPAGVRQINDASYSHNEYVTQRQNLENERQRKMASDGRTGEPVEVTSRSEANDSQHEWYKKMYNTIHKVSDGDGYVTVRYKTRRAGQYPYKTSTNGYASEPERNYNSDYSIKYKTLDRRRNPSSENTLPNPMKSTNVSYKNQPGKIENFTPGHSSATDKERREWWDEVMDIFNVEQIKTRNEINKVCEGNLSRALKDQGYESDSTLVFRKKDSSQIAPLSPVEQKQAYLNLQAGGEAPLQGFRKPAPEKPRECENTVPPPPPPPAKGAYYYNPEQPDLESARRYVESDVNIHYKTPVRYEIKDPISDAELIHRQEQAKKLYQEERRRKYLQELQDLNNRRHTDNFTPSQKSPISLHRYDDFGTIYDYVTKSSNYPKTVARALYNFQGQTSRELSFKKGDIIHIRREIDNNWYEGEINATIGLLPANYVEIISKDGVRLPTKKPTEGQARAKFNFQAQSAIELSLHKGELVVLTRRVDDNWFEGRVANQKGIFPVSYVEVLTDIGSDALPVVPSKPVGAPASHSLITSPNYQLSPRSNYSTDFTTTTNIISNGNHSPVVRETSKTLQKTEVLHVDTTNSEPVPYRAIYKYRPQNSDELELQEGDTVYVLEKCDDGWFVGTSQRTGFFGTFPGNYVEKLLL